MKARLAAVAALGFSIAWALTSAPISAFINWDQGTCIAGLATGKLTWASPPWNAHLAVQYVYLITARIATALGGTVIDGVRLATAIAFGAALAVMVSLLEAVTRDFRRALLLAAAWMTAWVNLFLLLSLEDNVLYLPFAAGVIAVVVRRADAWRLRDAVLAGVLAGAAALVSWQAILYVAPAVYAAGIGGAGGGDRRRRGWHRAAAVGLVLAAFVATIVAFCAWIAAATPLTLRSLVDTAFSRPAGNFDLRSPREIVALLDVLGTAGRYFLWRQLSYWEPTSLSVARVVAGALILAATLTIFVAGSLASWRRRTWVPHLLVATLTLLVCVTPFYKDCTYRYLIRFDFVPLLGVPLLAWALPLHRRWNAILAAVVAVQIAFAIRWDVHRHRTYPSLPDWRVAPHPDAAWYGRDGQSWFQYFRGLRRLGACHYVFDLRELADTMWQLEVSGALWSELPDHVAIGDPKQVRGWRYPPRVVSAADARAYLDQACTWASTGH